MPDLFEEFFASIGEDINKYLDLKKLSPSYKIFYPEEASAQSKGEMKSLDVYADIDRMAGIFETMES